MNACFCKFHINNGLNNFDSDRLKDRERFVELYAPDLRGADLDSRQGYRVLLKQLVATEHELPLRSVVNRLLARARLSKKPGEHMGMSVPLYTNCTSPLRAPDAASNPNWTRSANA